MALVLVTILTLALFDPDDLSPSKERAFRVPTGDKQGEEAEYKPRKNEDER